MRIRLLPAILIVLVVSLNSCKEKEKTFDMNILYLHHSTGEVIWKGKKVSLITRAARKLSSNLSFVGTRNSMLPNLIKKYNRESNKNFVIKERPFPKETPYGWHNYPFDYYNIWVKNAGEKPYMEEPTLEILTKQYQVIVFKHCFPVSNIQIDQDSADINSYYKSMANYMLQYNALRDKLHEFPDTKFIVWTGAALAKGAVSEEAAMRAREFFTWVKEEWDLPGDNIHIWDFYELETEGGLYLKEEYATSDTDSHPNSVFASKAVGFLFNRIVDVIENNGTRTNLKGEKLRSAASFQ